MKNTADEIIRKAEKGCKDCKIAKEYGSRICSDHANMIDSFEILGEE